MSLIVIPKSEALKKITGIAASTKVNFTPSKVSILFPVGNNFPVCEPIKSIKFKSIGELEFGTPSIL